MTTFHPRESRYGRREFLGEAPPARSRSRAWARCSPPAAAATAASSTPPSSSSRGPTTRSRIRSSTTTRRSRRASSPRAGTLRIYNWNGYLWPKIKKDFAKEYGVKVEETFFYTMDEAIAKISSGAVDFDVFFPTVDRLGRLVVGKLLQPLNHDYLPNLANVWPSLQDPLYDKGSQYTVPYVTWTTGIGYRTDKVSTTPLELSKPVRDLLGRGEQGQDVPARRQPRRDRRTCS